MSALLDRFLRYVRIDTQSDEHSTTAPSTAKQFDLLRVLEAECKEMGLADVSLSEFGVLTATVPKNVEHDAPAIAWIAHVDTSPETTAENVNPIVHENYDGRDIVLPNAPDRVIRVEAHPALKELVGATVITTDGTTLLGSDDKSGVAVIVETAARLMADESIPRGPIRLVFTPDEEIGRGIDHIDVDGLGCVCGYTLDGDSRGKLEAETFSADLAVVTVTGVNTHPSVGFGKLVNAIRILSKFIDALPQDHLSPETTFDRQGFLHPYSIEGGVAEATARIILRDFETPRLGDYGEMLRRTGRDLERDFPEAKIDVTIKPQYRNLRDGLDKEPRVLEKARTAIRAAGMEPIEAVIRGGTDGSILTEKGLPTPNLSCGEHEPHSPLEWTSLEEMESAVGVLTELARTWSEEQA